ncbi:MAG: DMT family transporter [Rhizobiaceae bacterium]
MNGLSPNMRGALFMMLAMAGYVLNDTFMKFVLGDLPFFEALFIRGIFATLFVALLCWRLRVLSRLAGFRRLLGHRTVQIRIASEVGGTYFFLTALSHMPIANVTAVLQILPLTITFAAAWVLGERVGWKRYAAILAGFCGVMLILRPGTSDFDIYAIYALVAVAFITTRDLSTRKMPTDIPTLPISLLTAVAIMLMGAAGMPFETIETPTLRQVAFLAAAAGILSVGYTFSISAMRVGDVSFVTPFRYSILLFALLLGFFVFGDVPDTLSIVGALIVVASGLFTFYRERLVARKVPISAASTAASSRNQ